MKYPGYQDWYKKFYEYIEKQKDKEPALTDLRKTASTLISTRKAEDPKNWKQNIYYELKDVQALEVKLNALRDTFDGAFDPNESINSATRMYLVN